MKDEFKLVIFAAIFFFITYGCSYVFEIPLTILVVLGVYFTAYSFISNRQLEKAYHSDNRNKFTQVFMGLTGIKILSSFVILFCALYFSGGNRLHTGIYTMSYYFGFTVFDVMIWRKKLTERS